MSPFPSNPRMALDAETLLAHGSWLANFARALVANPDEIDDVVQQTYAQALAQPPAHAGNLRAWLGTVARNVVRSRARSDSARVAREVAVAPPPPVESPVEAVERAELRRMVVESVLALEEPYRSAVILRFLEEREVAEIVRLTGAVEETVRTRIRRGVARVKELLERKVSERSRADADEGAAARALLFVRLREIAAGGGRGGAAGSAAAPHALLRAGGRIVSVATGRRVLVGAAVVAVLTGGWWWREAADRERPRRAAETAATGSGAIAPAQPGSPAPVAGVDRTPEEVRTPPATPTATPSRLADRLARRGSLRGVVTGPDGIPVPRARVWAILTTSYAPEYSMPNFASQAQEEAELGAHVNAFRDWLGTESDGGGRFEFTGLSTIPGWAIGAFEPTVGAMVTDVYGFDQDHLEIVADVTLMRGSLVHGSVRDEDGALIGGALLHLYTTCDGQESRSTSVTRMAGDRLGLIDDGFHCGEVVEIDCQAPGYLPVPRTRVTFTPHSKETLIELTMKRRPGVVVRGRIVDPGGRPAKFGPLLDAKFTTTPAYSRWRKATVRAGYVEGRFDLADDRYEVVVAADFHGTLELRVGNVVVGSAPLDDPGHPPDLPCDATKIPDEVATTTFTARFVDADSKAPIDLDVGPSWPAAANLTSVYARFREEGDPSHGVICYGCEPGHLKIEAEIPGYALTIFHVDVPRVPQREPTTLEVPRAQAGVRGTVRHADGRPFPKAELLMLRVTPDGLLNTGRVVLSNADGDFEFNALAKGDHVVVVSGLPEEAPVATRFTAAAPFPELEVRTAAGFMTRFEIHAGSATTDEPPVPRFRILDRDGVTVADLHQDWERWSDSHDSIDVPLQEGRYTVVARRDGFAEARVEFAVPATEPVAIPLEPVEARAK